MTIMGDGDPQDQIQKGTFPPATATTHLSAIGS